MTAPGLLNLTQLTEELGRCETAEQKTEVLTRAFELYLKESAKIEKAHTDLLAKFEQLNKEYIETNLTLKNKLDELDAVNDYLTSLLYNISQGLIFVDLKGNVTTYNRTAEEILQVPISKVLFNSYWEAFPDDYFGFSMKLALSLRSAPLTSYLTLDQNGQGKELEVETTFVLQPDPPEGATDLQGMIILLRDLTEIRRLEDTERRNHRMKELGEMAAMVAHEIRNPLGGIKGFASLLERDLQDRPDQQQMAKYIIEGTDNLNTLVTNVLNFSRPVKTQFESADFVEMCRDLINHVQADANTPTSIRLELVTDLKTLLILIDTQLMKAALLNLIFNSIQAMPNGGTITLTVGTNGPNVVFSVADTGMGITQENLKKVFSPFFTTKPKGNGFGLSEIQKVIEAHNGTIQVESTVGVGTVFTLQFPLRTKETIKK